MPLEIKAGAETAGLPTIKLAGKDYYVDKLRLRERIEIAQRAEKVKETYEKFPSKEAIQAGASVKLTEDDYLNLVDVIRLGLVRLYPTVTREELLDEPIEFDELFEAYPVIIAQGISRRASSSGEATAANQTASSGEGSSPI